MRSATLRTAAFAPIPTASVPTATAVNPRDFVSDRHARRMSVANISRMRACSRAATANRIPMKNTIELMSIRFNAETSVK